MILLLLSGCSDPASESDSKKLSDYSRQYTIYYKYNGDLYSIRSDGTGMGIVKDLKASSQDFIFNEDRTKIAFASTLGGYPQQIYIMNRDGSDLRRLTQPSGEYKSKLFPKFLPGGNAIVYNNEGDLYRINIDGSDNKKIIPDSIMAFGNSISISSSSDKIVFAGDKNTNDSVKCHIFSMNSDGSDLKALTDGTGIVEYPEFSPDGSKIIYNARIGENSEIFIMNKDGSGKVNLSNNPDIDFNALWSPDGSLIKFESLHSGGETSLYFVNPGGSGLRKVYSRKFEPNIMWFHASWSPDMTRMAFTDLIGDGYARNTVFILDIESGTAMKLTAGTSNVIWLNN